MSLAVNDGLPDLVENFFSESVTEKLRSLSYLFFYQNPYTLSFLKLNMVNYLIIFMNRKCYSIAKPSKVQFI